MNGSAISRGDLRQFWTLARANVRVLRARLRESLTSSKLMSATIGSFLAGYMVVGYFLFSYGLVYITKLPGLGNVLSERIFYLLFFFFFLMLAFSNAMISYTALYRSRETTWLLSLPVGFRALYGWRFVETLVFSSWGLIVISAPLLAAYGGIRSAPPDFYVKALLVAVPFVAIPAAVAGWALLLAVRYVNRWVLGALGAIGLYFVIQIAITFLSPASEEAAGTGTSIVATVNQVLRHTELSVHPLMPSTWISNALAGWSRPFESRATFYALLVLAYSLFGLWTISGFAWRLFYPGYNSSMGRRARASWRRKIRRSANGATRFEARSTLPLLGRLGMRRATRALIRKDFITFWRDPAQWVQFVIVFGLLLLYVLNLRNMGYDYESPFWSAVISHLNLGVCALSLSTLTTRFVFPQFSLEGRRLWILSMSPLNLGRIILQKFLTGWLATGTLTVVLIAISGLMLKLPPLSIAFYAAMIALMSIALNALAIGIGTLFPNLRESNPAKIVSGFGGTLCLILSFLYITIFILTLAYPAAVKLAKTGPLSQQNPGTASVIALTAVVLFTAITTFLPLFFAVQRVKKVEIFGKL